MGAVPDPLEATFVAANPLLHAQASGARGVSSGGQNAWGQNAWGQNAWGQSTVTIGVAVPIPEPFGSELQKWRESFHDPMARAVPTHVTLMPPTEVNRDDLPAVEQHLAAAALGGSSFPMLLQGTDTFRPISPVTFVRVAAGAEQCAATEARVRSGVLAREARFPYHPHVTVAHLLPDDVLIRAQETLADYEARFLVTGFALYLHGDDGVWRVRRYFPYGT